MQKGQYIGQNTEVKQIQTKMKDMYSVDFVLEKSIFNNIFEKDIRRVFIYKKAERLAKAVHLIAPAFAESASLRNRIDTIAIGLVDAAILPSGVARTALSRELLALSSVLDIAHTGGLLSSMNAELISREAHILLQEVAAYEEPRLSLGDAPTLSEIAKKEISQGSKHDSKFVAPERTASGLLPIKNQITSKGHLKDISDIHIKDRREAIMSVIKDKGKASIKDISMLIRGVSEKTIQRELLSLVTAGMILKHGERRWSVYSLT